MAYGYTGRVLHVDMSSGALTVEEPEDALYRKYMGGTSFGMHYILQEVPADADPLGPENVLTLFTGVLTGVPISGQSRITANAKSPLTDAIGDSQAGGFFPAELKFAGFDGIVVRGQAEKPMYLWLHDGEAELRDASHLWGLGAWDTETKLREELGDDRVEVACVGQGGENLVRYAAIMNMRNRACGRTGMGAVMGSKNLKAIAVRGRQKPEVRDSDAVKVVAQRGAKAMKTNRGMEGLGRLGTAGVVQSQEFSGGLPTRNYASGHFEHCEDISGERMEETILVGRDTCYACVVRCKREVEVDNGYKVEPELGGPEYETIATFGSYLEIGDLKAIAKANALCNDYGLDTVGCGATIAWATECFENGLLTLEDTDGIELRWGSADSMLAALEAIAFKRGKLGDLLSEGSAKAAKRVGPQAEKYVVAVKGHELPAHMPQVKRSMGLIYSVNPFGADHQSSEHDPGYEESAGSFFLDRYAELGLTKPAPATSLGRDKVEFTLLTQYWTGLMDSLCLCQFDWGASWQLYGPSSAVDAVNAVMDWNVDIKELMEVGARRVNMLAAFNARAGFTREDDKLPPRLYEPLQGGVSDGVQLVEDELENAKDIYYEMAGWSVETGNPTPARLQELGLDWVVNG